MKMLIFSGFLGAGKTSALLPLARRIVETGPAGQENQVVILENEVGEIGVDDAYLRSGGLHVDTLFSGCACCSMAGELGGSVMRIQKELNPEWLILETTGIAYPKKIQETLQDVCMLESRICVLVDASRWKRLRIPMAALLSGQIIGSDTVLVNKIDLVDPAVLPEIDADIRDYEPNTAIAHISALSPIPNEIWDVVLGEARV